MHDDEMRSRRLAGLFAAATLLAVAAPTAAQNAEPAITHTANDAALAWSACPDFMPAGCALTVLTRVISKKYPNKAAIDAGGKTMTRDTDLVKDWPGVKVRPAGAEYGMLVWEQADREPKLGDTAELVITNLDLSVNVFDRMFVCEGDRIVDVFSILGRSGAPQR